MTELNLFFPSLKKNSVCDRKKNRRKVMWPGRFVASNCARGTTCGKAIAACSKQAGGTSAKLIYSKIHERHCVAFSTRVFCVARVTNPHENVSINSSRPDNVLLLGADPNAIFDIFVWITPQVAFDKTEAVVDQQFDCCCVWSETPPTKLIDFHIDSRSCHLIVSHFVWIKVFYQLRRE